MTSFKTMMYANKYQILTTFMPNNYGVDKILVWPKFVSNNAALLI